VFIYLKFESGINIVMTKLLSISHDLFYITDCETVPELVKGTINYVPNTEYQGKAEFKCVTGYTLVGSSFRTCMAGGTWSDSNPICQINGKLFLKVCVCVPLV